MTGWPYIYVLLKGMRIYLLLNSILMLVIGPSVRGNASTIYWCSIMILWTWQFWSLVMFFFVRATCQLYILLVSGFFVEPFSISVSHSLDNENSGLCFACFTDYCGFILFLFDPGSMYGITTAWHIIMRSSLMTVLHFLLTASVITLRYCSSFISVIYKVSFRGS